MPNITTRNNVRVWHLLVMGALTAVVLYNLRSAIDGIFEISGVRVFDGMIFGYSFATFEAGLAALGETGRWNYLWYFSTLDMAYGFMYGCTSAIAWELLGKSYRPAIYWAGVGVLSSVIILDYMENLRIGVMLAGYSPVTEHNVAIASFISQAKWAAAGLFLVMIAIGVGRRISMQSARKRKTS